MAEPLKDSFSLDVIDLIAEAIDRVHPDFPRDEFIETAGTGFLDLELTARARHISEALAAYLPDDRREALRILTDSLGPPLGEVESDGMASFKYLPHVFFVADHGLPHFEEAMAFQHEVTRRFTAEYSVRVFIDRYPEPTLQRLQAWTADPDMHVRRLVSEGTRPRLPWAPRLHRFIEDPEPVIDLLGRLKDDPTEYVRRSVANNLNDISKDHPDLVVAVLSEWVEEPSRSRLIRHALRSLVKQGHPGALGLLGYGSASRLTVDSMSIEPSRPRIGERVTISVTMTNPTSQPQSALVDLRVHFVKANGATSPKVFKLKETTVGPGHTEPMRKSISLAQHTTRTHYPGRHRVELLINGVSHEAGAFEVGPALRGESRHS